MLWSPHFPLFFRLILLKDFSFPLIDLEMIGKTDLTLNSPVSTGPTMSSLAFCTAVCISSQTSIISTLPKNHLAKISLPCPLLPFSFRKQNSIPLHIHSYWIQMGSQGFQGRIFRLDSFQLYQSNQSSSLMEWQTGWPTGLNWLSCHNSQILFRYKMSSYLNDYQLQTACFYFSFGVQSTG